MPDRTDMEMTTKKAGPGMLIDYYKATYANLPDFQRLDLS